MLRILTLAVCASVLPFLSACRESENGRSPSGELPSKSETLQKPSKPKWPSTRILVNNFTLGPTHGCDGGFSTSGRIVCGRHGKVSAVSWNFVGRSEEADIYEIERIFPLEKGSATDQPTQVGATTETKQVFYKGARLVVFEDQHQRVILYPVDSDLKTGVAEAADTN
ncbi:MAG: hypothetical protein IIB04_07730 [Acidobacteria bacterium]|nr:hypothetical protein [Acidobacteriota bacterium]